MSKKKKAPPPGPDDLVRASAGNYRSGDDRFEVQKSAQGWYVLDTQHADELGQQLIHGPFSTLDAVRNALPAVRQLKPMPRILPVRRRPAPRAKPKPPPRSWIDELPAAEGKRVRQLIGALENKGIEDAEELVRRQLHSDEALIAARLLDARLGALLAGRSEAEQALVMQAIELVADSAPSDDLPGWSVVEVEAGTRPQGKRITPRVR